MKTKGIRILDKEKGFINVKLQDILEELPDGHRFYWSILFLEGIGHLGEKESMMDLEKHARESKEGACISWKKLNELAKKFEQLIDLILIGNQSKNALRRYDDDQEMYEACDVVIVMFDSSFWEVFSKDFSFIHRLGTKFKDTLFLESDFQKNSL